VTGTGRDRARGRAWAAPGLALAGVLTAATSAVALAAAVGWAVVASQIDAVGQWPALLGMVLVYDLALVATAPAILPGLYAVVAGEATAGGVGGAARTLLGAARDDARDLASALLRARVAGLGYSLLVAPVVVAALLVVATAGSVVLYALGVLQTPNPVHFLFLVLAGILAVRAAGQIPVANTAILVVEGESPRRSWRESAVEVWDQPRAAGGNAVARVALGAAPFLVAFAALLAIPTEGLAGLVIPLAAVVVVGTVTKPIEATVQVRGRGRVDRSTAEAGRRLDGVRRVLPRPSRATILALLVLSGLALASAGVRVADVRPNPTPSADAPLADPGSAPPATLYDVALNRTQATSRNASVVVLGRNLTTDAPVRVFRVHASVDFATREVGGVAWHGEDGRWVRQGQTYASDGLYVPWGWGPNPRHVLHEASVGGWVVYAAPTYADVVRDERIAPVPTGTVDWTTRSVTDDAIVLTVADPESVRDAVGRYDASEVRYRSGSLVQVRIDREAQRLERVEVIERVVHYEHDSRRIRDRRHSETTITYRYGDVAVARPDEVGFQPAAALWDLLYY